MDIKMVLELDRHNVYYVKNNAVSYYITIPKVPVSTNIAIELKSKMDNYNVETNDYLWVMENVKNTFSFVDEYNITLVLPILNEDSISILEKMDVNKFEYVNNILSIVINCAYLNLKNANMQVGSQIVIINNDRYHTFIEWFTMTYKGRVIHKKLIDLIQLYNVNATAYKKLDTPAISFVVGNYANEVDAPKVMSSYNGGAQQRNKKMQPQFSSGFSSYVFLAGIMFVVAIVIVVITLAFK